MDPYIEDAIAKHKRAKHMTHIGRYYLHRIHAARDQEPEEVEHLLCVARYREFAVFEHPSGIREAFRYNEIADTMTEDIELR